MTDTETPEKPIPTAQTINGQPIGGPSGPQPPSRGLRGVWADFRRLPGWAQIATGVFVLVVFLAFGASEEDTGTKAEGKKDKSKTIAAAPADPIKKMTADIRSNTKDELGDSAVIEASCTKAAVCEVSARIDEFTDDREGIAREVGGLLHELFRDTDAKRISVYAFLDLVNVETGKDMKDSQVAFITVDRAKWQTIDWDNLQHLDPIDGLERISVTSRDFGREFVVRDV